MVPTCSDWAMLFGGSMSSHASTTIEPLRFIRIPPATARCSIAAVDIEVATETEAREKKAE
jgi:hypothetical protein